MDDIVFIYIVDLENKLVNTYDMLYIVYAMRKQTLVDYKEYFDKGIKLIKIDNFDRSINPTNDKKRFFKIKKIVTEVRINTIRLRSSKTGTLLSAITGKVVA